MLSIDESVGMGRSATGMTVPSAPLQQLGAAPGTAAAVPGLEGSELEEEDGLEFASSGEAAEAPRFGNDDYDLELSPEYI